MNERQRLEALRRYEILDTPAEETFDRFTRLASQLTGAPTATVALVDEGRLWFKSRIGIEEQAVARDLSFSTHAILSSGVMVVEDTLLDPRFRRNPRVVGGPRLRFYAGAPIVTLDGFSVGTLCVLDVLPRSLDQRQREGLADLAALVAHEIDGRIRLGSETALRQQLEAFVRFSHDAAMITDIPLDSGRPTITYVNEAFERLSGYARTEVIGKTPDILHGPLTDERELERIREGRKAGARIDLEIVNYRKSGEPYWVDLSIRPVLDAAGKPMSYVGIQRNVTGRRMASEIERRRGVVLQRMSADAPLTEILQRIVEFVEFANPGTIGSILHVREGRLFHAACGPELPRPYAESIDGLAIGPAVGSCGTAAFTGRTVIVSDIATDDLWADYRHLALGYELAACWSSPIASHGGQTVGTLAFYARTAREPTIAELESLRESAHLAGLAIEQHRNRENLERLALYDALTDLPNRTHFETVLGRTLDDARFGEKIALGLIDLDRFKVVNDSLGHADGDRLLVEVASRLSRAMRPEDVIARMGGDEFLVLLRNVASREAAAEIGRRVLGALDGPFYAAANEVFVRASMGIAVFPDDAIETGQLLRVADRAMYRAKARGGGVALPKYGASEPAVGRVALESSLNHAIENDQLHIDYQILFDLETRRALGAEALLRWTHPELGDIPTTELIGIAEETGLIVPIGAWVLMQASRQAHRWQEMGGLGYVAVNVSARQFEERDFVDVVARMLAEAKLPASRLYLELTERLVMRAPETAATTLRQLKDMGVRIAIDDFGTGYSSLSYLRRFPLDALKIDISFVRDIVDEKSPSRGIVSAIITLSRALGLQAIAEGIESEAQLRVLCALGCKVGQGFALGLPVRADQLPHALV